MPTAQSGTGKERRFHLGLSLGIIWGLQGEPEMEQRNSNELEHLLCLQEAEVQSLALRGPLASLRETPKHHGVCLKKQSKQIWSYSTADRGLL